MSLKGVLSAILLVVLFTSIAIHTMLKVHFSTQLKFDKQVIKIVRDAYNIPQIFAPSYQSALYAWGYVTAEDRLFQMAFRRCAAQGRLSEVIGEKGIESDKMFRELDMHGWAVKTEQKFKAENITEFNNFKAYAQGINDYAKSLTLNPIQFYIMGLKWEQWTVADMFTLFKLLKWSQSQNIGDQYIRSMMLKNYTKKQVDQMMAYQSDYWMKGEFATRETIVKDDELTQQLLKRNRDINIQKFAPAWVEEMIEVGVFQYIDSHLRGSNSWVISGNFTESGHPIMCSDPHLDSSLPGEWYQVKINYKKNEEEFRIVGASIIGIPSMFGKTSYVAISFTTIYGDSQDLFKETIKDNHYLFDTKWRSLKVRKEIIKVKGHSHIEYPVYETHHGPLINFIAHRGYLYRINETLSLSWAGHTDLEFRTMKEMPHLAEIKTFSELQTFMQTATDHGPPMNLLYVTKDDHIGYQVVGPHPLRRHPHMGMYVKDGSDSYNDWIGFIRGADKLHIEDPKRGYIVTANNKPVSEKYQNGLFDISIYTARADRLERLIRNRIHSGKKFNKRFMKDMQLDVVDNYCLEVVAEMNHKMRTNTQKYFDAFVIFRNFNCSFTKQSTTASLYLSFMQNLYQELYPKNLTQNLNLAASLQFQQYIHQFIVKAETDEHLNLLRKASAKAVKETHQFFGTEDISQYHYGKMHQDLMIHRPFSEVEKLRPYVEQITDGWGNQNTPNVGGMNKFHEKDYTTSHRANIRAIISYHEDSEWIVDGGTSEKFYSKHYKDQSNLFFNGEYLVMDPINKTEAKKEKQSDL